MSRQNEIISNTSTNSDVLSTNASKMLEAALLQMDGIISGNNNSSDSSDGKKSLVNASPTIDAELSLIAVNNVLSTAKTLALALQQVGFAAPIPDSATMSLISDWLETHIPRQDADERLRRLQRDKEALTIQYQLLADRVSEQADKILELEGLLHNKTQLLNDRDEQLQRLMLSRSSLETQKLELMSALSELKLHRAALERENVELREFERKNSSNIQTKLKTSKGILFGSMGNLNQIHFNSNESVRSPQTPPVSLRHQIHPQYHSLPRTRNNKFSTDNGRSNFINSENIYQFDRNANMQRQRNVAFASKEKILIGDSASTFPEIEQDAIEFRENAPYCMSSSNFRERSSKGLKGILGKLRRSNSGNLELPALKNEEIAFKRGVVTRATTGGRIEWNTQSTQLSTPSKGYKEWTTQEVCNWLTDLGLGCYSDDCRKWLNTNSNICFFTVSPVDIERELNLKSLLHRKKILLAIDALTGKEDDPLALKAAQLDVSWVVRWLDDIGLPQYKDSFLMAKIDGRMLHRLTMEDLAHLHVHSCLHIASFRCGIQCMREIEWNAECLIRRSAGAARPASDVDDQSLEEEKNVIENMENISLWTAHRVMEWLRVADLSEYAPNLRGAGVHGALMLYEQRFTADLLADLLSIPPSKTLLRRHLATHFKELLGRDIIQNKRDVESKPGYQPLTITSKIKPPKKTQFSLKRRKSSKGSGDVDWTDYVCPMSSCLLNNDQDKSFSASNSCSSG